MTEQKLTRRQKAEMYLQNPNMRRMLNVLSFAEGTEKHGYHTNFGGSRLEDLSWHPNKVLGRTKDGVTTATGRYQFLGSTFNDQAKKLGLKDFGAESQDLAAVGLIMDMGAVNDVLNGDVTKAVYKLRNIWASLPDNPSRNQPHKTHAQIIDAWNKNGGNVDPSFIHPTSDLYRMNGQKYDYSTTQPNTHTAAMQSNLPQMFTPNIGEQLANAFTPPAVTTNNGFENYFNSMNSEFEKLDQFEPEQPKISNRQKYQQQLADAFGIAPQVGNGLPDYIGDMVRSIYDQTA
ncbi:glycoside hydrolase family 104 protein [Rodentibacter pneumotropicus]|uniref:glycoside hydrolase family 24 protein n=1 Tax=Rodentibacter pneumotropicus TaxID=758 RepID=UPI00232EED18|nr:glycoside hydrolase family 104 protein [Rodentibacter pneumotropicus]MDC2824618.1 glycoside hydrolase family 104 protein [Rodentibacter pneumotropicus]